MHTLVEALKLAFADRDHWIADPRFTKIPIEQLLSKRYAEDRRKLINPASRAAERRASRNAG